MWEPRRSSLERVEDVGKKQKKKNQPHVGLSSEREVAMILRFTAFSATFQLLPNRGGLQLSHLFLVNWITVSGIAQTVERTAGISV